MRVTWVVSPNGLGHARRALAIARHLAVLVPEARLRFVVEPWQVQRLGNDVVARLSEHVEVVSGLIADAPRWPLRLPGDDLLAWRQRLADSRALDGADLVISDNLAGVLALAPDTVLAGSFLWSDVLAPLAPRSLDVARFVDDERELLARYKPAMLCVDEVAMLGVRERTRAQGLPWMGERATTPVAPGAHVAILGGASGAADVALAALAAELAAAGVPIVLAADVAGQPGAPRAPRFDHSPTAYAQARIIVCRPGVGTLTDALVAGRPLLLVDEPANPEMLWNAQRLCALGCAEILPDGEPQVQAAAVCALLADDARLATMAGIAALRPMGGAQVAAQFLQEELVRRGARAVKESS